MVKGISLACLGLLAALVAGCGSEPHAEPGLKELSVRFREANRAEGIDPMLSLYHLEGTDKRTVNLLEGALQYELGLPIAYIDFQPLSGAPEETIDFIHDGTAYGPSLKPAYRMRVVYDVEDRFTSLFTVGRTPTGTWKIICARPKPEPAF